jgi:hypothetical protein
MLVVQPMASMILTMPLMLVMINDNIKRKKLPVAMI